MSGSAPQPTRTRRSSWVLVLGLATILGTAFELIRFPAGLLLGPMIASIIVALRGRQLGVSPWAMAIAQSFLGLLIARGLTTDALKELGSQWPLFIGGVLLVLLIAIGLGALLMRLQVLPGSTAVWGAYPGNASTMSVLAQAFGEDIRLVAFMQYLRVFLVVVVAASVAFAFGGSSGLHATDWTATIDWPALGMTAAFAITCAAVGRVSRLPAGPLLLPLIGGAIVQDLGWLTIELPAWLLALAYAVVGIAIGGRFDHDTVRAVRSAFWRVLFAILALIAMCGLLSVPLAWIANVNALTAYLAMSPGGADSVAIIATTADVNAPFVLAMQTARMILVIALGPPIARWLARRWRPSPID